MHIITGDNMKKVLCIFILSLVLIISLFGVDEAISNTSDSKLDNRPRIVIDAGHGGVDAGAIATDGTAEKGINLDIALKLYDYLSVSGYKCDLIRRGDYEIYPNGIDRRRSDLYNRMDYINTDKNSILISIHQNHYENESEWGSQIWYSPNDKTSKAMADSILDSIKSNIQQGNNRTNKPSDNSYYLLYRAEVPSIMIECGFISNIEENEKLQNKEYQRDMAYSILLGLNGVI